MEYHAEEKDVGRLLIRLGQRLPGSEKVSDAPGNASRVNNVSIFPTPFLVEETDEPDHRINDRYAHRGCLVYNGSSILDNNTNIRMHMCDRQGRGADSTSDVD